MKIYKKIIPKGNLMVFVSYITITVCLVMILSLSTQKDINKLIKNGLYTGHQSWLDIAGCDDDINWKDIMYGMNKDYNNYAIYTDVPDSEFSIRGIGVIGEVVTPPMLSGVYFDTESSFGDVPKIVVGEYYRDMLKTRDGKQYFTIGNTEYEVIGVMGTEKSSRLDYMVIMNLNEALKCTGSNTEYMIDALGKTDVSAICKRIGTELGSIAEVSMMHGEAGERKGSSNLSMNTIIDSLDYIMLLSFILSNFLVTYIWLQKRKSFIESCTLCGYTTKELMFEIYKRYFLVVFTGYFMGLALILCMAKSSRVLTSVGIRDMAISFLFTVGIGICILAVSKIKQKSP